MNKIVAWIVAIIGLLMVLPLVGVSALEGAITDWVVAVGVLVIGVGGILKKL